MKRIDAIISSTRASDTESDTAILSNTSAEGVPRDVIGNTRYIKITPQEMEVELRRDTSVSGAKPRRSLAQLQEEKIYGICLVLRDVISAAKMLEHEGYEVVYRFHGTRREDKVHGGTAVKPDLKARSEITGKVPKTVAQLKDLAHIHASQNKKSLADVDSSFISTVTVITKLLQHTFPEEANSPGPDPHLRTKVFNNAPYISAFCVPSGSLSRIKEGRGNAESEMIYDTSRHGPLSDRHPQYHFRNPIEGQVQPELDKFLTNRTLANSRDEAIIALNNRAKDVNRKMQDFYGEHKDQPISESVASQYSDLYTEYTKCYSEVRSTIERLAKELTKAFVTPQDIEMTQSSLDEGRTTVTRRTRFADALTNAVSKTKSYVDYNESESKPNPTSDIAMRSQKRQSIVSRLRSKCPSTFDDEIRAPTTPRSSSAQFIKRANTDLHHQ